jgi:hypothetical protein
MKIVRQDGRIKQLQHSQNVSGHFRCVGGGEMLCCTLKFKAHKDMACRANSLFDIRAVRVRNGLAG